MNKEAMIFNVDATPLQKALEQLVEQQERYKADMLEQLRKITDLLATMVSRQQRTELRKRDLL